MFLTAVRMYGLLVTSIAATLISVPINNSVSIETGLWAGWMGFRSPPSLLSNGYWGRETDHPSGPRIRNIWRL